MTLLTDTLFLSRAGDYSAPLDTNAKLPIVYGDLTDGSNGVWTLPALDTTDDVYAFAGHEVLSVANGNSITIYEDGMELHGALYVFDEKNDFEGNGDIATINFTSPKANAVITAQGKGKPTATGGATLLENAIDIIDDILTVESDFTSALYEATAKSRAAQLFTEQAYVAAGVIDSDMSFWDILTAIMGSFLGAAHKNGLDQLVLELDTNTTTEGQAGIVARSDSDMLEARQRLDNIVNQIPSNYAYSYSDARFTGFTDTVSDATSQTIFGVRKPETPFPFFWCRDLTSVQTVQAIIVAKYKDPIYEIAVKDFTMKRLAVDVGDFFVYSAEWLYGSDGLQLNNNIWRCIGVRPDFQTGRIIFRGEQTRTRLMLAYIADGTYIADGSITAGNEVAPTL